MCFSPLHASFLQLSVELCHKSLRHLSPPLPVLLFSKHLSGKGFWYSLRIHFVSLHCLKSDVVPVVNASVWSSVRFFWAPEYFKAFSILDHKTEEKESDSFHVVFVVVLSKQLINPSTSKSSYFWKSSVCELSLMPAVCTHLFSFHCVYQHVWHYENDMTCDAFNVSDVKAANKSLCLFYPVWLFFQIGVDLMQI